jgi:hypothetical protein
VILHSDDRGIGGARRRITFEVHAIIEFQWQSGNEDRVLPAAEFQKRGLAKPTAAAKSGHVHGNANRAHLRKEARQLLGASLFELGNWRLDCALHCASLCYEPESQFVPQAEAHVGGQEKTVAQREKCTWHAKGKLHAAVVKSMKLLGLDELGGRNGGSSVSP